MIRRGHNWNRWWTFVTVSIIGLAMSSGFAYGFNNFFLFGILIFLLGGELGTFLTYILMKDAEESRYVDRTYPKGYDNEQPIRKEDSHD